MQDDDTLESGDPKRATVAAPGAHIGKYEILRTLGAGGMGVVWAARDPDLDREVAIKLLRAEHASPDLRTRLLREARAMARLKHPNVLTVYEVASDGGRDFIVMELVDGHSLDVWLREAPSKREIWDALLAAGRGLAAAHAAGLIHRDFKPHNVLRSRDGRVLVTDFGLARGAIELEETVEPAAADSILDVQLTATGQLLGTPAYMAPEQFDGATDARTDQFGFCVTAWEALSGTRPYEGTTIEQLRAAARSGTPRRDANLPPGVRAVLARGLAPDPASRWEDMPALLAALERTRRRWPRRLAVIAPLVVIAGIAGAFALRPGDHANACDADRAFGSAWTPAQRADVLAKHPELASFAPRVDAYAKNWHDEYSAACRNTNAAGEASRACYREQRDELALYVDLLQRYPARFVGARDFSDLVDGNDPCARDPVSRPPLPNDARRDKILAFLAKAYGTLDKPGGLLGDLDLLRNEAKAIGWPPLDARLEELIANATASWGIPISQPAYHRAAELAHAVDDRVTEARARIGILEESARAFEHDVLPSSGYDSQLRDAELAVHAAGDDDRQRAVLDHLRAQHAAYVDGDLTKAIDLEMAAMLPLMLRYDVIDMTDVAAALAMLADVRGRPKDLQLATAILDEAMMRLKTTELPNRASRLRSARYWTSWLGGDVEAAHAALEPISPIPVVRSTPIGGRVVDAQGKPVAGATVVIWRGNLYGDRARVFTNLEQGALTTTAADGSFHARAAEHSGVIAELGDQRSMPVVATDGVQLVLGPTRAVTGTVDSGGEPNPGIEPYARIEVLPDLAWHDSTAPAPDGRYTIAGIPAAATHVEIGAIGSNWPHDEFRRVLATGTTIHWPLGDIIDVIVPESVDTVWLLRGNVAPATLDEVKKLAAAPDALEMKATAVGWANATVSGLVAYGPGAHHAVFHDVPPGSVTACLMIGTKLECQSTLAGRTDAPVRDGRHWPSGTTMMLW